MKINHIIISLSSVKCMIKNIEQGFGQWQYQRISKFNYNALEIRLAGFAREYLQESAASLPGPSSKRRGR